MKKRIITFLALGLFWAAQMTAQSLIEVTDFWLAENDPTANTPGTRYDDDNGERCALIKIHVPVEGFSFDTGNMQTVHQEDKLHEKWLWVSPNLQKLTIMHANFDRLSYQIPIPVDGGCTYEMLLDIGTGRYVTIVVSKSGSDVVIDGEFVGKSPVINYHLDYGSHDIVATNGKFEGTAQRILTSNDEKHVRIDIDMKDLSHLYGDVFVDARDATTDIVFNGQVVATGKWTTQLREGRYTIMMQKANCDPATTDFNVERGKTDTISANLPIPHTGKLGIYTKPRNVETIIDGKEHIDATARQEITLPVGKHQVEYRKKGYDTQTHEYTIRRYETTDTIVQLKRTEILKKQAFYFGAGYTLSSMSGITGILGTVMKHNDIQLSYTFGASQSDPVNWYGDNGTWLSTTTYKRNVLAVKYGYQFDLLDQRLAITPQVGYSYAHLGCNVEEGSNSYADNASAHLATVGVKLLLVPIHHVYVFAAPQYALTVGKSNNFDRLSKLDIKADGFSATLGVLMNF